MMETEIGNGGTYYATDEGVGDFWMWKTESLSLPWCALLSAVLHAL